VDVKGACVILLYIIVIIIIKIQEARQHELEVVYCTSPCNFFFKAADPSLKCVLLASMFKGVYGSVKERRHT
jgi:hypothetical protein